MRLLTMARFFKVGLFGLGELQLEVLHGGLVENDGILLPVFFGSEEGSGNSQNQKEDEGSHGRVEVAPVAAS